MTHSKNINLGLKENWLQFLILVIINGFVGGMVGLERSILPQLAEVEFHIEAKTAILPSSSYLVYSKQLQIISQVHWPIRWAEKNYWCGDG